MKIIKYKNLDWYVLKENDKEKLLFLKDSFTNDQIKKYFTNKEMIDSDYDVRFNKDCNPWWRDSYIRQVLNTKFVEDLDINDLSIMETTVELNGEKSTTRDYVRLITKEEVEELQKTNIEVLKTERYYGYWTMSPFWANSSNAVMFGVWGSSSPGHLSNAYVHNTDSSGAAVRPVISLKSSVLVSEVTDNIANEHDCEVNIEEIKRNATNKELADKLNELIRDRNTRLEKERELKENESCDTNW